jgi:hypothetical protein
MPRRTLASDSFPSSISASWTNGDGDYDALSWISSGVVRASLVGNDCSMRRTGEAYPNDQWSQITVGTLQDASGIYRDQSAGCRLKSGTDESGYWGNVACRVGGVQPKYGISEVDAAFGFTTLASTGTVSGTAIPPGTKITLEVIGTAITLYTDEGGVDTNRLSTTDATITSGAPGIKIYVDTTAGELVNSAVAAWAGGDFGTNANDGIPIRTKAGPGVSPRANTQFRASPRGFTQTSPDVTLSLTGQAVSLAQGTLLESLSIPLTGQAATFVQGTLTAVTPAGMGFISPPGPGIGPFNPGMFVRAPRAVPTQGASVSLSLTGQAATFAQGTLLPTVSYAASGIAVTSAQGTLSPSVTIALTGLQITTAQGTLTTGSDITRALTGQAITVSGGTLVSGLSVSASGIAVTTATGTLAPTVSFALIGQQIASTEGVLSAGGDVTRSLSGQTVTISQGSMIVGLPVPISSHTYTVYGSGDGTTVNG